MFENKNIKKIGSQVVKTAPGKNIYHRIAAIGVCA